MARQSRSSRSASTCSVPRPTKPRLNRADVCYRGESAPRPHPPQGFRHDAVPPQLPGIIGGQPQGTERQFRNVRDLPYIELSHLITRLVIVGVLSIEELHDGDAALEVRPRIGARIVVRRAHIFVASV